MMKKMRTTGAFTLLAIVPILAIAVCAAQNSVEPPAGAGLLLTATGDGSQVYTCTDGHWILKAPDARLLDERGQVIGTHFAGPTWRLNDGSEVKGQSDCEPTCAGCFFRAMAAAPGRSRKRQRQAGECALHQANRDPWWRRG